MRHELSTDKSFKRKMPNNFRKPQKKITFIIWIIILLLIQGCQSKPDLKIAKEIADRLKIDPTWEDIQEYLTNFIEPGKKREEIHDLLDKIGPYTIIDTAAHNELQWDPDTKKYVIYETIQFNEESTFKALSDWYFLYDGDNVLVLGYKIDPY